MSLEIYSQQYHIAWLDPYLESLPINYALHSHEIIYSFVFYFLIQLLCPIINPIIFKESYTEINNYKKKLNWDIHVVAMVQAIISIVYCIWLLLPSQDVLDVNVIQGQTYNHTFLSAITIGYFVWDLMVCSFHFDLFGFEFLIHAMASLFVFTMTLIPFMQYWIPRFLLFELSSPFVNINWFISNNKNDKKNWLKNEKLNLINGLLLLITFFSSRIAWGFFAIFKVIYISLNNLDQYSLELKIIGSIIVLLNFSLDCLNLLWFSKMIKIAKKVLSKKDKKD